MERNNTAYYIGELEDLNIIEWYLFNKCYKNINDSPYKDYVVMLLDDNSKLHYILRGEFGKYYIVTD